MSSKVKEEQDLEEFASERLYEETDTKYDIKDLILKEEIIDGNWLSISRNYSLSAVELD